MARTKPVSVSLGTKFDFGGKRWGWGQATKIKCK